MKDMETTKSMARILVVDDEEDLCEILRFNLETEGYAVDTACSAEEALQMDLAPYDLFYNPDETLFMKKGARYGANTKNGLEMLLFVRKTTLTKLLLLLRLLVKMQTARE